MPTGGVGTSDGKISARASVWEYYSARYRL